MRISKTSRLLGVLTAVAVASYAAPAAMAGTVPEASPTRAASVVDEAAGRQAVDVGAGVDGLSAPASAAPGPITFRVSTSHARHGHVGLVRLNPGVSLETFVPHLVRALSHDPEDVKAGGRALTRDGEFLGGAATVPGKTVSFSLVLQPGTYYLIDFLDFETATPAGPDRVRALTVAGRPATGETPRPEAVIASVPGTNPRFVAPARIRPGAPLLVVNLLPGQVNEAILYPVPAGTTDAQLADFFRALDKGEWSAPPFDTAAGLGATPLSPGRSLVLEAPVTPGRYALVTWVHDIGDAHRLGAKGVHGLIDVE
ncbi:hypothetical protein [Embleya sp. NBC_00896]|uniref:hypothetical protein n=1 Tax=Embleya sp. NBC_00896 TaxID=2975961 RepID=UPI002F917268|nr:hypothetical protein OG928_37260 [Embleya sp. NBC_00896]